MPLTLYHDNLFLEHQVPAGHPERSARLKTVMAHLREQGLLERCELATPDAEGWTPADDDIISRLHDPELINRIALTIEQGQPFVDVPDCPVSEQSLDAARLAVGAAVHAVDTVLINHADAEKRSDEASGIGPRDIALILARPPGHHAEADRAMGFCLFNTVALAAQHAIQEHKLSRVAIVDFDVHHGNGTQHLFENRSDVLFISTHEDPLVQYPGTGFANEIGKGDGQGFTLNCPLESGSDGSIVRDVFDKQVLPKLREFDPELLIISAGFDAHQHDPLGGLNWTTDDYRFLTRQLLDTCNVPCVCSLEGGYNLQALADCVAAHLRALLDGDVRR